MINKENYLAIILSTKTNASDQSQLFSTKSTNF